MTNSKYPVVYQASMAKIEQEGQNTGHEEEQSLGVDLFGSILIGTTPVNSHRILIGITPNGGLAVGSSAETILDPLQLRQHQGKNLSITEIDLRGRVESLNLSTTDCTGAEVVKTNTLNPEYFVNIRTSSPETIEGRRFQSGAKTISIQLNNFLSLFENSGQDVLLEFASPTEPTQESRVCMLIPAKIKGEYDGIFFVTPDSEESRLLGREEMGSITSAHQALENVVTNINVLAGGKYTKQLNTLRASKGYKKIKHPLVQDLMELQMIAQNRDKKLGGLINALRPRRLANVSSGSAQTLVFRQEQDHTKTPINQLPQSIIEKFALVDEGLGGIEQQNIGVVQTYLSKVFQIGVNGNVFNLQISRESLRRLEQYQDHGYRINRGRTYFRNQLLFNKLSSDIFVLRNNMMNFAIPMAQKGDFSLLKEALGGNNQREAGVVVCWLNSVRCVGDSTTDINILRTTINLIEQYQKSSLLRGIPEVLKATDSALVKLRSKMMNTRF